MKQKHINISASRRDFLKTSATLAGAAVAGALSLERSVHAAGSDVIRIGLIGCGVRGTEATINAFNAGPDIRLTAMADVFAARQQESLAELRKKRPAQVEVKDTHCFLGFDAYRQVIASGVDAVLITPASHFIPEILRAAVAAGKHVFCEKPHGIDMPGVAVCEAAAESARQQRLSLVSGLCWRYDAGVRETMRRVHDGAIGDIVAIQENYVGKPYYPRERLPGQNEMQYQLWNWYHFNWLSGDQTAQQIIHSMDKASWALGDQPPQKCWGMGGRQTAVDPVYGDQFDHQAMVFEYANGVRVFGFTRDQLECYNNTSDIFFGTKGRCDLLAHRITGETNWHYDRPKPKHMYDLEHEALFQAIRTREPLNNGHYMCLSSRLCVLAQIACYTGNMIGWEDALQSKRSFSLPRYGWDVAPPVKPGPDGRYPTAQQGWAELDKWIK